MSTTNQPLTIANAHDEIVDAWSAKRYGTSQVGAVNYYIKSSGEVILSNDSRCFEHHFTPANEDRLRVWLGMFLRT
jgi:hypothetical protein